MVGHLHLQGMEDGASERGREGLLDSPDSGLPPSPSPSPPPCAPEPGPPGPAGEAGAPPPPSPQPPALALRPRLRPVLFGEGIEVSPEPAHEIRCNSEVRYASEQHFRDKVEYGPVPTVTAYSETIVAAPNCTWRSYRSQLTLEPRPRALRFACTAIIFPKRARRSFRTTLLCGGRARFSASVQLRPGPPEPPGAPPPPPGGPPPPPGGPPPPPEVPPPP
ncbi:refilin-A [Pipistrellus kuhlii]|uniref:Refilin A n=1 Tax=Pipistrellus kuhlii TaxID=59472 RepID=A0A7J7RGE8_PIPKU|nr:refilin-A [Pipistrellus kuhlii]KAF6275280.1 refilin A [Pipistrellus kuhlii]